LIPKRISPLRPLDPTFAACLSKHDREADTFEFAGRAGQENGMTPILTIGSQIVELGAAFQHSESDRPYPQ
jgi:hypothetical protein